MAKSKHYNNQTANPQGHSAATLPKAPSTTIVLPTAGRSPTLPSAMATHRQQTANTETILIETSSNPDCANELAIVHRHTHHVRTIALPPKQKAHPCRVITEALDIAIAIADTEWAFLTHDDVWIEDPELIEKLIGLAKHHGVPIVGYEMSPRSHITEEWRDMVSHTATLLHVPTVQGLGLRWSLVEAHHETPWNQEQPGWPDTETNFGREVKRLKIPQYFIGHETNERHYRDQYITHRRSLTSHLVHPGLGKIDDAKWIEAEITNHMERD
jgi:hypothetical protein